MIDHINMKVGHFIDEALKSSNLTENSHWSKTQTSYNWIVWSSLILFIILLFFIGVMEGNAQTVTPTNTMVPQGATQVYTAAGFSGAVTWSLRAGSSGSLTGTNPSATITYHAPASVVPLHSIAGCQIGAPDSIFNTRIDGLSVDTNSSTWMASLTAVESNIAPRILPSFPLNRVTNSQSTQTFHYNYTQSYDSLGIPLPSWPNLERESGVFSSGFTGVDRHVMMINSDTCQVSELYNNYDHQPYNPSGSGAPPNAQCQNPLGCDAQSLWQYYSSDYSLSTPGGDGSTSAAGVPLLPLALSLEDFHSGILKHAVLFSMNPFYIDGRYIWPATQCANCGSRPSYPPFGARFRLKSTFDISGFSATAQIVLLGLQHYGAILTDGGGAFNITSAVDVSEDRLIAAAIEELAASNSTLNSTQFEIVDESGLEISANSQAVLYGNGLVTPPAYAILRATDGTHIVDTNIPLLGLTLTAPAAAEGGEGGIWITANTPIQQLTPVYSSLFGADTFTWSMSPTVGTLVASGGNAGKYTAPATESSPTTTTITVTSVTDNTKSITFPLTVLPAGAIYIDAGNGTTNPNLGLTIPSPDYGLDANGNTWWRDQGGQREYGVNQGGTTAWYANAYWPATPDIGLVETYWYDTGDTIYRFLVPNGFYRLDYYVAVGNCGAPPVNLTATNYLEHLESQGILKVSNLYPLGNPTAPCYTENHQSFVTQVTNNKYYFAIRRITDYLGPGGINNFTYTLLSAFSVTPVASPPAQSTLLHGKITVGPGPTTVR